MKKFIAFALILALLLSGTIVYASDVSDAACYDQDSDQSYSHGS